MAIYDTISKKTADALFDDEAILFGNANGIPEYRIVELFGEWAAAFIEKHICYNGYMVVRVDYNVWDDNGSAHSEIRFFSRAGFYKIVSEHNYRACLEAHRTSEAGRIVDALWQARLDRLAAADAENKREREERKAKRAAARRAKLEAEGVTV